MNITRYRTRFFLNFFWFFKNIRYNNRAFLDENPENAFCSLKTLRIFGQAMNIFVGNLNFTTNEDSIQELFEPFGEITSVNVITDRETGRSRGFAFVQMPNVDEARAAMTALDGKELDGRNIRVNEARERTDRPSRGGGGGGDRDRRGGGGGGRGGRGHAGGNRNY